MLNALAKKTKDTLCPVILEARPVFGNQQKTVEYLKKQREYLGDCFDP